MKFIWMNSEQNKIRKAKKVKFDWRKITIAFNDIKYDFCHNFYESRSDWNHEVEKTWVNLNFVKKNNTLFSTNFRHPQVFLISNSLKRRNFNFIRFKLQNILFSLDTQRKFVWLRIEVISRKFLEPHTKRKWSRLHRDPEMKTLAKER